MDGTLADTGAPFGLSVVEDPFEISFPTGGTDGVGLFIPTAPLVPLAVLVENTGVAFTGTMTVFVIGAAEFTAGVELFRVEGFI